MLKNGTIFVETWFEKDYAEFRLVLDETEPMGENIRIGLIQRIFGLESTVTTICVPRKTWEELLRTRTLYQKNKEAS